MASETGTQEVSRKAAKAQRIFRRKKMEPAVGIALSEHESCSDKMAVFIGFSIKTNFNPSQFFTAL
jgi:hypothetical protein